MSGLRPVMLAVVLATGLSLAGCGYNTIPTKQERAQAAWADLQGAYQRRADLIPNLVATVQAAAAQERAVLNDVAQARAQASQVVLSADDLSDPQAIARYEAAQARMSGALNRLLATVEAYPTLQSNRNFIILQSQIEGAENRIDVSRRDYNEAVRDYNTSLRTLPSVMWARTVHASAQPMQPFSAAPGATAAPSVRFDIPNSTETTR